MDFNLGQPSKADEKMFEFYRKNPALACIDILHQDLDPFQRITINNVVNHPYSINILSRGSGKTRMIAMIGSILAMFNPKMKIGFLGPQFRTAKLAFAEFETLLNESSELEASLAKPPSKLSDMWRADFKNGASIFALPLAADSAMSIRGTRLHMALIDEYPHVPVEVIERVINPMLATQLNPMKNVRRIQREKKLLAAGKITEADLTKSAKNRIAGFSSAYFKFNHMYATMENYKKAAKEELAKTGKTDYCVNVFNFHDGSEGFFDMSMIEHSKRTSSEVTFAMEYLSEFPDDSYGFFKRSLIESCKLRDLFYFESRGTKDGVYFLGIDPARNSDAFSIVILKLVEEQMRLVRVISFENTPFPQLAQYIRMLLDIYNVKVIAMDAGGGGLTMKDLLADPNTAENKTKIILDMDDEINVAREGAKILKMVDFAPKWISDANFDLRASMEHKRLVLPDINLADRYIKPEEDKGDAQDTMLAEFIALVEELQSIVVTATKTGVLHFDTQGSHMRKDRYSALLIAHAAAWDYVKAGYQTAVLGEGGFLDGEGNLIGPADENYEWQETKILDDIARAKLEVMNQGRGGIFEGYLK